MICRAVQFIQRPAADPDKIVSFSDNAVPGALYVSVMQRAGLIDATTWRTLSSTSIATRSYTCWSGSRRWSSRPPARWCHRGARIYRDRRQASSMQSLCSSSCAVSGSTSIR